MTDHAEIERILSFIISRLRLYLHSTSRFPWSLMSMTTSSPQWTHGSDLTPTISLSATVIQM